MFIVDIHIKFAKEAIWYGSVSVPDPEGATAIGSMKNDWPDAGVLATTFPAESVPIDNVKVIFPEGVPAGISHV